MASVTFSPARLQGSALVPPSKSEAHRALLLAALGRGECCLNGFPPPLCDDVTAMINGIAALGAKVRHEGTRLMVTPAPASAAGLPAAECCVHACAAALRMLIPVFLVRGQAVRFAMDKELFQRPLDAFDPLMNRLGAQMTRIADDCNGKFAVELTGRMPAGSYEIDGSRSSQFASGMLLALAHAADENGIPAPSSLAVTGPIVSRPYLDMTLEMMNRFRISCTESAEGMFSILPASQPSPVEISVAGDWSQAAVFLCMNAMGSDISVLNLAEDGLQGDSRVRDILKRMQKNGRLTASAIDCSDIPDLAPILALTCSQADGVSTFTGVSRLRIKESDRLLAMQELLARLGVPTDLSADSDTLRIYGPVPLKGGFEADARGDHRLVMFLAAAALIADAPITVHGAECISKSWLGLIQTYQQLGGIAE